MAAHVTEALRQVKSDARAGTCSVIIFGGSGDLARRKILPALFNSAKEGLLPEKFTVIGCGKPEMSSEAYREMVSAALREFAKSDAVYPKIVNEFVQNSFYVGGGFDENALYQTMDSLIKNNCATRACNDNRIYYLATPPTVFATICQKLAEHNMSQVRGGNYWRRIIIEKPFGRDLESARALNAEVAKAFEEWQVYRIDHYLGKETVQNVLAFRFANGIFEPLWNRNYIDHIQITAAEALGVEDRGGYYDNAGALRDMIQNHVLQVMALVAMEPPTTFDANAVRDERVKVMRAIRPVKPDQVNDYFVRGQYGAGQINGKPVPGYRTEPKVDPQSNTETYVAAKFYVDNWRWAGVPFYLRTGKRMPRRDSEIAIFFKRTPHMMFTQTAADDVAPNVLVIQIQPDESITMSFEAKVPGPEMQLQSVDMHFNYKEAFQVEIAEAYQRLILDCMRGDATLFMRKDMVEVAWWLVMPVLEHWKNNKAEFPNYAAGSWGPEAADKLLNKDGRKWRS
ncbi:glucose-6-phosphate dehydrogenase [bacterium]|nr:glucose-6-phosphate dehydrogenase [bacterium]NUN44763.1 glucose-6-phosphate dehydrogenase [bacterium]